MRSSLVGLVVLSAVGCSDSNGLPDATLTNAERTETIYALTGTPVATASGYAVDGGRQVRTDLSDAFDFAYNVQADGQPVFIPRAALGIDPDNPVNPGFQARTLSFDDGARTVTFRILIDDNCGFRGLEPGLPQD